ncbi:MAG: hypothetical protein AAFY59_04985 [Pseudomonadota bacterium]
MQDPTDETLAQLLKKMRRQDTRAFEALYDATAPRVYAFCQNALTNRQEADLLFIDCFSFIMAWEDDIKDQTVGRTSCLISMFYSNVTSFVRAWLDELKDYEPPPLTSLPPLPDPLNGARSPDDVLLQEELADLRDFLRALSQPVQLFVRAAYLHSESYTSLAGKLGISPNALRDRVRTDIRHFMRTRSEDWQNGRFLDGVSPDEAVTALEDVLAVLPVTEARQFGEDIQTSDDLMLAAIAWARLLAPLPMTFFPLQPLPHLKREIFANFKGFKGFVRRHFLKGIVGAGAAAAAAATIAHLPEILAYRDKKCCVQEESAFMRLRNKGDYFWAATATVAPDSIYGPWSVRLEQHPEDHTKASLIVAGGGLQKGVGIRIWVQIDDETYHYISEIDDDSHFHVGFPWKHAADMSTATLLLEPSFKAAETGRRPGNTVISEGKFYYYDISDEYAEELAKGE